MSYPPDSVEPVTLVGQVGKKYTIERHFSYSNSETIQTVSLGKSNFPSEY